MGPARGFGVIWRGCDGWWHRRKIMSFQTNQTRINNPSGNVESFRFRHLRRKDFWPGNAAFFTEWDLEQAFLVIAATNNSAVNDEIARLCHERGIPVNHAGDQSQCDFQFPAIVRNDLVVIGINAGGKNHGLVKREMLDCGSGLQHL